MNSFRKKLSHTILFMDDNRRYVVALGIEGSANKVASSLFLFHV